LYFMKKIGGIMEEDLEKEKKLEEKQTKEELPPVLSPIFVLAEIEEEEK
jgi:hypothetical protein